MPCKSPGIPAVGGQSLSGRKEKDVFIVGKTLVATGRGGTGKTTFVALAAGLLDSPPLLIDADPDQSLAAMLGVEVAREEVRTISDVLYDIQKGKTAPEFDSMPLVEQIDYLTNMSCLYEDKDFDLISLGVKWTRGCYCHPNDVLHNILPRLASNYRYTLVDAPGGLEHLNRRVMSRVSHIFVIMDPSTKALRNVERVRTICEAVDLHYDNLYLVANHRFRENELDRIQDVSGATYLGRLEHDASVEEYDWQGRSLLELPEDSPARSSVRRTLKKAGCAVR